MIEYTWSVNKLDCFSQKEGQSDVVFVVHWACQGTDGTYSDSIDSTCMVDYESGTPYTPFAQLTQDQVLGWIWASGIDKTAIEDSVRLSIEEKAAPSVVSLAAPWAVKVSIEPEVVEPEVVEPEVVEPEVVEPEVVEPATVV